MKNVQQLEKNINIVVGPYKSFKLKKLSISSKTKPAAILILCLITFLFIDEKKVFCSAKLVQSFMNGVNL